MGKNWAKWKASIGPKMSMLRGPFAVKGFFGKLEACTTYIANTDISSEIQCNIVIEPNATPTDFTNLTKPAHNLRNNFYSFEVASFIRSFRSILPEGFLGMEAINATRLILL